jgi:simple sugar transport system ATP-binding protein/ribose transport system ATP-binding protein
MGRLAVTPEISQCDPGADSLPPGPQSAPRPILRARGIVKSFGHHRALDSVDLTLEPGSVHGLVGENGAGKSTLSKVISGVLRADAGCIEVNGKVVSFRSPADALRAGITIMEQELSLAPDLTVAENVLLGRYPARYGILSRRRLAREFAELSERTGFTLDGSRLVGGLPLAMQQEVEILRALGRRAQVIVMDEPTAALSAQDSERLHDVVRGLRESGIAVVYISHFLDEVLALSDHITIMRNGQCVQTVQSREASVDALVLGMTGTTLQQGFPARPAVRSDAPVLLEVRDLRRPHQANGVDLTVRAGEIVGIFGLVGSGRSEFAHAVFGAAGRSTRGRVLVDGVPVELSSPAHALRSGIALLPESRKDQGLFLGRSQRENATISALHDFSTLGVVRRRDERRAALDGLRATGVVPLTPENAVGVLSGGNQQKVLFAKTLLRRPRVVILDEPTRGVDVASRRAIYDIVVDLVEAGMAVILISSEYDEVAHMSHRLLVMRNGSISGEFDPSQTSHDAVLAAAFGITPGTNHLEEEI